MAPIGIVIISFIFLNNGTKQQHTFVYIWTVGPSLTTLDIAPLKGLIQEKMFAGVSALTNTGTDSSISK